MTDDDYEPDHDPSEPSDNSTDDEAKRHWFTNDLLAFMLTSTSLGFIGLTGYGWLNLQTVPAEIMYVWVASWGTSVAWAFGSGAVETWRGGDSDQ